MQSLKAGEDNNNFVSLINEHKTLIYKVCNTYCNDSGERQDLFQEIIIQLWKSYPNFRGEARFSTWLYRIALNTAISALRKKKLHTTSLETQSRSFVEIPADESNVKEQRDALQLAIDQLSPVEKAIVMMYLDDKSYEEMEAVFGISQNTLRVKMNRIKEKLRKLTQAHLYGT
jgi:RNA polymerase sigma-70 factor (ECF subfamily)